MDRNKAFIIVNEYIKSPGLLNHMLSVEVAMGFYARKLNQDVEKWKIVGLLHDFDWEIHPTMETHPLAGAPILREKGVSEEIIRAIVSHGQNTGVDRISPMEKALFACDELTGLITAVALVRPSKSLLDLTANSVKKKWKDRLFAAGVNRQEIELAAQDFGVNLWEHVDNVILAMRSIAPTLNLVGNISPQNQPEKN